jgi:hypothetical protein
MGRFVTGLLCRDMRSLSTTSARPLSLRRLCADQRGLSAVEYLVMLVFVLASCLVLWGQLGQTHACWLRSVRAVIASLSERQGASQAQCSTSYKTSEGLSATASSAAFKGDDRSIPPGYGAGPGHRPARGSYTWSVDERSGSGAPAPARPQIAAAWGASTYRHGGLMTGVEHIMYRHGVNSGFKNVSRFADGATARDIVTYVDEALRSGVAKQTGPSTFTVEYNFGRTIGTNLAGEAASSIRVFVRDGIIQTAFPF